MTDKQKASTAPALTHVEKVQQAFINKIKEDGLLHTLEWISVWYERAAQAELDDALQARDERQSLDNEAAELFCLDKLLPSAETADNFSTSPGHNLMRLARMAAVARELNRGNREYPSSSSSRYRRWERWGEARRANEAAKAPAPAQE